MSIKIYDAYKVKDMSLDGLFKFLCKLRKEYSQNTITYLRQLHNSENMPEYYKLYDDIKKAIAKGLNDPYNIAASVLIIPFENELYIKTFLDRRFYNKKLPTKYFKDFHYQDQCDKPKDISGKEWGQRRKAWDEMAKMGDDKFALMGLTFEVISEANLFNICYEVCKK